MAHSFLRGIAQLVEQRSPKPRAEGSKPSAPANPSAVAFCGLFSCCFALILAFSIVMVYTIVVDNDEIKMYRLVVSATELQAKNMGL